MRRAAALALAAGVVASGCATIPTEPSASGETTPSPAATPGAALPSPGRPYTADAILEVMTASRRPGGVPDALLTDAVARLVAAAIWTIDGTPWDTAAASGACTSATTCTLELAGSHREAAGEDVWILDVDPVEATLAVADRTLGSVPDELWPALDASARLGTDLEGLRLTAVRWKPPPEAGRFDLSYRDAGEEGGCTAEVTLDAAADEVVADRRAGC